MEPMLASIMIFGGNFAPRDWAMCMGQLISVSQNPALFSVLGTIYGGNGTSNFALPDLQGRVPVGKGCAPGAAINWNFGMVYGQERHLISLAEIPSHTHEVTIKASPANGASATPGNGNTTIAAVSGGRSSGDALYNNEAPTVDLRTGSNGNGASVSTSTGGNSPINMIQPSLGVNYIIAMQGYFPSRN